jgi:signal transduction histidine kinase
VPVQHERAQRITDAIDSYVDAYSEPLVRAARAGDPAVGSNEATEQGKRRVDALRARFDRLLTTERELAVARVERVQDVSQRASVASIVGLTGSALLIVGFGIYLTRAIVLPLRRASTMARRLAGDDLAARMTEDGIGEIGTLQRSFNAMAGNLQRSRAEVAASRARVVAASDETRRRIERDLHDGVQQRLVTLGLHLRAAEGAAPADNRELEAQLERATQGLAVALQDLQEVSRGIHPAILSKGGLVAALRNLARRAAVPIELHVESERRLPESVEVAAYYVVSEALTNATKHAQASVVEVHLDAGAPDTPDVRLTIRDDGVGGADPRSGSGLVGLRDRVEAIGGTITITSLRGEGTTLVVTLPAEHR